MDRLTNKQVYERLVGKKIKSVEVSSDGKALTIEVTGGVRIEVISGEDPDIGYRHALEFEEKPKPPRPLRRNDYLTQLMSNGKTGVYRVKAAQDGQATLEFVGYQGG